MPVHECQKEEIIEAIRERLGNSDVNLAIINQKLDQILEQVKKTNGRVTALEKEHYKPRMNAAAALAMIGSVSAGTGIICGSVLKALGKF